MNKIVKEKLKQGLVMLIIVVTFLITIFIMLKYKTEGETNLPYNLTKIMVISSAEANAKEQNENNNKWNLDINQYNDIYIEIGKNNEYKKQTYITEVKVENIYITNPNKGTIEKYMPNPSEGKLFLYEDNLKIVDSLTYNGAEENNTKKLQIANQGGTILFRVVNRNISEFMSNDDSELKYDGTLLKRTNVNLNDVKVQMSFDLIIKTNKTTYKGKVNIDLPCGNIEEDGVSKSIKTSFEDIIFKRQVR